MCLPCRPPRLPDLVDIADEQIVVGDEAEIVPDAEPAPPSDSQIPEEILSHG